MSTGTKPHHRTKSPTSSTLARGKLPILVSVSLHNLFPDEMRQKSTNKWFRPEHASSLLHQVRLEIAIAPTTKGAETSIVKSDPTTIDGGSSIASVDEETIIFTSPLVKTVHPSWNHLDEAIEDYLALDDFYDSETSFYRLMRLRIWLLMGESNQDLLEDQTSDTEQPDKSLEVEQDNIKEESHDDASQKEEALLAKSDEPPLQKRQQVLMDISIHPSRLHRLASQPEKLPINCLILKFSDGSIRTTKSLLKIIGDQDGSHSGEGLKEEFGRFKDDVFRTLDAVKPSRKQNNADSTPSNNRVSDLDSAIQSLTIEPMDGSQSVARTGKPGDEKLERGRPFQCTEQDIAVRDEESEMEDLNRLIQQEQSALKADLVVLNEEKAELQVLMDTAQQLTSSTEQLRDDSTSEEHLCRQAEFFLEARRIKLLRDSRSLYPITHIPHDNRFLIRDLRIPVDTELHSGIVAEDELAAALGFLCHLVMLVSKYLGVQLRYRMFCNSSRSAIQEDGAAVFPLFQARVVERDQLDHGVLLLQRNVECILKTRDIEYNSNEHILVNMKRLVDAVVDGT